MVKLINFNFTDLRWAPNNKLTWPLAVRSTTVASVCALLKGPFFLSGFKQVIQAT